MTCKRCGSSAPEFKPDAVPFSEYPCVVGSSVDLIATNPRLLDQDAVCVCCAGMSMQNIIDRAWDLKDVPTDALLRALARRFL